MSWFAQFVSPVSPVSFEGDTQKSPCLQGVSPVSPVSPQNDNNLKLSAESRETLEKFAIDLGFQWSDLLEPSAVAKRDAGAAESWLTQALDSVQPAAVLKREGASLGYSGAQLEAARLAIGAVSVEMIGVKYWRLPDAMQVQP